MNIFIVEPSPPLNEKENANTSATLIPISLRCYFTVTSMSLRCCSEFSFPAHFDVASISRWFHSGFIVNLKFCCFHMDFGHFYQPAWVWFLCHSNPPTHTPTPPLNNKSIQAVSSNTFTHGCIRKKGGPLDEYCQGHRLCNLSTLCLQLPRPSIAPTPSRMDALEEKVDLLTIIVKDIDHVICRPAAWSCQLPRLKHT